MDGTVRGDMAIRINDVSVVNSFNDTIPDAAAHGVTYLRAVAKGVQECAPPVTMSIDSMITGGFRAPQVQCLVVAPTSQRLKYYRTAHFGIASGSGLRVGWYLVGGERAGGRQVAGFSIGAVTDIEADEVMSITERVHDYAVIPAMQEILNRVQQSQQAGGFFGV
jgi:hypothetical protein